MTKTPLLPKDEKKLKDFSGVSIIIVSDGIDKKHEELKGVILHDIMLWPWVEGQGGTSVSVNIVKAFKKILGEEFIDNKSLCIINVTVLDSKGTIPEGTAKSMFDNGCLDDTYPVDIAIVPGGPPPTKEDTLKSIWKTKKRFICVTAADKDFGNETLYPEMITIGVSKFTDDMITSGVLDFCVPMEEHKSVADGVGAAVGMIAGLLWKIKQSGKGKGKISEKTVTCYVT